MSASANTDQTGRAVPGAAAAAAVPAPGTAAARGRSRRVVRTLLVGLGLLALAFGLDLLVPRPNSVPLQIVDVRQAAAQASRELGFQPSVPSGLDGWTVTIATLRHGTNGITTWHLGLITPEGNYAGVDQAATSTSGWESVLTSSGDPVGFVDLDGRPWERVDKAERNTVNLILREQGRTTLVSAKVGGLADAERLIRSLPPQTLVGSGAPSLTPRS